MLAIITTGAYPLVSDAPLGFWFWVLIAVDGILAAVAVILWIFERPRDTWLVNTGSTLGPHDLE
jgi:hypothetical protein